MLFCFFFQAEDGIRDVAVTGVQTCALPISRAPEKRSRKKGSGSRQTRHASFPRRKSKKPGRRDPTPRFAESIQPVPGVLPFCISSGWPHPDDLSSKIEPAVTIAHSLGPFLATLVCPGPRKSQKKRRFNNPTVLPYTQLL